jgi:beta-N-acetylhexosaminidase
MLGRGDMISRLDLGLKRLRRLAVQVSLLLLSGLLLVAPAVRAQDPESDPTSRAKALLAKMTVEQKVGQLFLVTFVGNDPSLGTDIAKLIRQDHIGGVVLLASNSNFYNDTGAPRQVAELSNALQALAMGSGAKVPLFMALDHEGDSYPYTRVTQGTTPLPNAMAIGATWDPANARDVGQIVGREMAAMGINLLLGPVVDVLNNPRSSGQGDIGTRAFGGDPWWVGQMGRAYVEGVHQGSNGRVATVAKHFPGHGGSDRLPDEEVATVDKSLQELKRIELVPFFAVTHDDGHPDAMTDALMSSHIRYRGFQGNLRQFTAPISFDAEGMGAILDLPELAGWQQKGLIVSDSLGVPAVRKYFDPSLSSFPHRRIAKEAFLAGNDLLLLSQFDLNNVWADQLANIRDTIVYFREEYQANPAFAARVDEAVVKILQLKIELYPTFALSEGAVRVPADKASQVCGQGVAVTQRIANQAITLLYPDANALPAPPRQGEQIVILTDVRPVRECFTDRCPTFSTLSQTAVQNAIAQIYGPQGSGQINPEQITSLSFGQLKTFLAAALSGGEGESDVSRLLREADWILFASQDLNPVKGPNSDALKLFLDQGLSLTYNAKLVVLAFSAPYYLDTTEISKLTLYLGAYSKTEPFVQAAVRSLFRESPAEGASPVDVEGINYDLPRQLSPDSEQIIPLALAEPSSLVDGSTGPPPASVCLQAGPIVDYNGHPVPDGTEVSFQIQYLDGTAYSPPETALTRDGLAVVTMTMTAPGSVHLVAYSGDTYRSQVVDVVIPAPPTPTGTALPTSTPTAMPTATEPARTATPTPVTTPAPLPSPTLISPSPPPSGLPVTPGRVGPGAERGAALLLAAGATSVAAAGGCLLPGTRGRRRSVVIRWGLLAVIGGMVGYILYVLQIIRPEAWGLLPEAAWASQAAVVGVVLVCAIVPLGVMAAVDRPSKIARRGR